MLFLYQTLIMLSSFFMTMTELNNMHISEEEGNNNIGNDNCGGDIIDRRLTKEERLSSKTLISNLFTKGNSFVCYPFRVVYSFTSPEAQTVSSSMFVSVPKKKFKRAVKRNLIRRRTKEAYRLNKNILIESLKEKDIRISMAILYLDKEIKDYHEIEKSIKDMLYKLRNKVNDKV